jgi:Uncharacterised nucleotidyltransferase
VSAPASADPTQDIPVLNSSQVPEWVFLRAAVSQQNPVRLRALAAGVRWRILLDLAERHGVQPLLYQGLSRADGLVPAPEMRVLAQLYQANLHKSLLIARELIHLVDHLAGIRIEVLAYKGVALAEPVYGDMALRQTGDIDLLIHSRDLLQIQAAVRELGYVPHLSLSVAQERPYLNSGYEYVFDGRAGRNLLELQWAILPRFYAVDFDHDELFRRAVSVKVAGHPMKTPSPEDLFLILSVHAAKHVWGRLIWLCDLARIMCLPQLDWSWIASQSRVLGIVRILRVSLLLTSRLLQVNFPEAADRNLPADPEADALASEIEAQIANASEFHVESLAYFKLMLRLRENRRDRRRFLTRLILTPGPGEWSAVRLPEPLFPLYHLVRLWRLAGKVVSR